MNVTINTDASFHPIYKVGGYAFWIACDKGRIKQSGTLKEAVNSTDCELKAIANALYVLEKSQLNDGTIRLIIINSDAKTVMSHIKPVKKKTVGSFIYKTVCRILSQSGLSVSGKTFKVRHVKAHTGKLDKPRSWVNDWCDREAKKGMKEALLIQK